MNRRQSEQSTKKRSENNCRCQNVPTYVSASFFVFLSIYTFFLFFVVAVVVIRQVLHCMYVIVLAWARATHLMTNVVLPICTADKWVVSNESLDIVAFMENDVRT